MLSAAGNTLTLTAVNGNTTCPGGDLVFNCTITTTTADFNFNWRREGATLSSGASYLYTDGNNKYPSLSFDDFTINAYNIPPDYTLTSIHCYTGVFDTNTTTQTYHCNNCVTRLFISTVITYSYLRFPCYNNRCSESTVKLDHCLTSNADMATSCW